MPLYLKYFIQIVKIQEATVQEEALLNQTVRFIPDLGPLTAGKGFRSEIDTTMIESGRERGERQDRENGIEMLTKTGQGAGSERDSENGRERGKREGSWTERETDSYPILLKERETELLTFPLKKNQQNTVKQNWTEIMKKNLMVFVGILQLQRRKGQTKI